MIPVDRRTITIALEASLDNVALAGIAVRAISASEMCSQDEAGLIELAVCEAINNAIIHALKKNKGEVVEMEISLLSDRIAFKLCDCGEEMPGDISNLGRQTADPLATSGRGVAIMREIMDTVRYERIGGRNILILEKLAPETPHPST